MTLTVEDGTGVVGADSYITLDAARAYAVSRGLSLSTTDATAEIQLRSAFDFIENKRASFKGVKSVAGQPAQWPRTGVYIDGELLDSVTIPPILMYAQVHAAAAIESGLSLMPNSTGESFVTREKVGEIEIEYSATVSSSGVPILRMFDALIAPLLVSTGALITERA